MITSDHKIIAVVPARSGSKGVPGKNIRPFMGKPLLAHTVEAALACPLITDVVVSTDSIKIQKIALDCGAQVPFLRPAGLSTDKALAIPTIQHAVREMEQIRREFYDVVVMLQPTTPLRTSDDLTEALQRLLDSDADGIISVVDVDNWHPMKMKRFDGDRLLDYEKPPVENPPRQFLPPVFMVNGAIYATRRHVFMERGTFQGDNCLGYIMPFERSVNIDTELDFIAAEYYLEK